MPPVNTDNLAYDEEHTSCNKLQIKNKNVCKALSNKNTRLTKSQCVQAFLITAKTWHGGGSAAGICIYYIWLYV